MGILSGLSQFGVNMDDDIYGDNKAKDKAGEAARSAVAKAEAEAARKAEEKKKSEEESSYILARSYTCPVCDKPFKSLAVKANRARVVSHDLDLRPNYEPVDSLKYTVISCPFCGYSARERNFPNITVNQKKMVREKVGAFFNPAPVMEDKKVYSYEDALGRFQMAFATAMATVAKSSEKAYLCLYMSWLVRGQRNGLTEGDAAYSIKLEEYRETEKELRSKALEGFIYARQTEDYPMCGMDQYTVDYIIAALFYKSREFDKAMKLLPEIIISSSASRGVKEKARILKEKILAVKASKVMPDEDSLED
ncbi:MAG: DUF2225 domain-containing protein [Lachnospiraceae bacterium]|nr:DUF2225 domain-containing protein [Lachnospiraceae bacterium]